MSPLSEYTSSLLLEIVACPNCQLWTFDATSAPLPDEEEPVTIESMKRSMLTPFDITGGLCGVHWQTAYAMASSSEMSPDSLNHPRWTRPSDVSSLPKMSDS
jgi:hypothetical protein